MGKIIARVRRREDRAEARRAFEASPFGRLLANPQGGTLKFRRCFPPEAKAFREGFSIAAARQPEEQAKNEAMRQRVDELPIRPDPNCPECNGRVTHCGNNLCLFGVDLPMSKRP